MRRWLEPSLLNGASAERRGLDRFDIGIGIALPLELGAIGLSHRHYNCRHFGHMRIRAIILSLLLLLPFVPSMAQEQDTQEAIPMTYIYDKPTFNGGDVNEFAKWINEHKCYPEEAKKAGIEGRVTTQFTITDEGKLVDVRILRGVHPLLDQEAIRVIESAPQKWKAGKKAGKPKGMTYTFPVVFQLSEMECAQVDSLQFIPFDYGIKERKPSFNGGDANEFSKWVHEHKIYPEEAKKAGIEGRVYTHFTITKEGKLTNLKLLRSVHPLLDQEAIRVIESAPQIWKPGLNYKGEPIDVNYTFPVLFSLPKE